MKQQPSTLTKLVNVLKLNPTFTFIMGEDKTV